MKAPSRLRWGFGLVLYLNTHSMVSHVFAFSDTKIPCAYALCQDEAGSLLQSDIPDMADGDAALLDLATSNSGAAGSGDNPAASAAVVGSTSGVMSFKLGPHFWEHV